MASPFFSLVVPTRDRPDSLKRFLASIAATATRPEDLEIILVVDADDPASQAACHDTLSLRLVVVPPGLTMGRLNTAGVAVARGRHVMLLNDDVEAKTPGWDVRIRTCLRRFPDDIVLIHVNDTLFRDRLCTFPLVSRTFCRLAGGICPPGYVRYRIDDHIEDVFNQLTALGKRRTVYFPDLRFEHHNTVARPQGDHVYAANPMVLARDDQVFEEQGPARKELVLRLLAHIEGRTEPTRQSARQDRLARLPDPFLLRRPGRQRVERSGWVRAAVDQIGRSAWVASLLVRARRIVGRQGYRGLVAALGRRLALLVAGGQREADRRRAAAAARYPTAG